MTSNSNMESPATILFVDDEPGIRTTLSSILSGFGFTVTTAATVPEALNLIATRQFDVLVSDLNIGHPADGFTVVSAMRRTQPNAITFILTGYPDFESALEAIRQQVDDYLVKPTDINALVENIRQKLANPRRAAQEIEAKRLADVLEENKSDMVQQWLLVAKQDAQLSSLPLSDSERAGHLAGVIEEMIRKSRGQDFSRESLSAATAHGKQRFAQGYAIPMIVREARILQDVVSRTVQNNLLRADISFVIPDMIRIGGTIQVLLEESIDAYLHARDSRTEVVSRQSATSILLLSADRELALLRASVLKHAGFAVTQPDGISEAMRSLKEKKFDALIISYSVKTKNAAEMTRLFQQQNPNSPIITMVKGKWQNLKTDGEIVVAGEEGPEALVEAVQASVNRKKLQRVK